MTADEIKQLLHLVSHPREGGCYVRTWESGELLADTNFADARYAGPRHAGTAIYYLLEPGTFSEMHRLRSDEIFHFYGGDPVEMLQLHPGGNGRTLRLGNDLLAGHRPQIVVPRGVWQGSHLIPGGRWALLGCTVVPGFDYDDYETAPREQLCAAWPADATLIVQLTRPSHDPDTVDASPAGP